MHVASAVRSGAADECEVATLEDVLALADDSDIHLVPNNVLDRRARPLLGPARFHTVGVQPVGDRLPRLTAASALEDSDDVRRLTGVRVQPRLIVLRVAERCRR